MNRNGMPGEPPCRTEVQAKAEVQMKRCIEEIERDMPELAYIVPGLRKALQEARAQ